MNKKLIGTLASVVLLTGITTGTTSLAQEVDDGTNDEQNTQPVVSENKSESAEQNTQSVVTEQKSEPVVEQKVEQPVEQKVIEEPAQEVVEEHTSNKVDDVEINKTSGVQTDDIQSELEVEDVDKSVDENEHLDEETSDDKEEVKEEIEAPDLSKIEPETDEAEEVDEEDVDVENEKNEETVEVQSIKNTEDESFYNTRYNQQDTSSKKPKQIHRNDTSDELLEDEATPLDEITSDTTKPQPLALHDEGSETKYIVELVKEGTDEEEVVDEEETDEAIDDESEVTDEVKSDKEVSEEEVVDEEETDEAKSGKEVSEEVFDEVKSDKEVSEEVSDETEAVDKEEAETTDEAKSDKEVSEEETDESETTDETEAVDEEEEEAETTDETEAVDEEAVDEEEEAETTDETEAVDEEAVDEEEAETTDDELKTVDEVDLSEPVLVGESESSTVDEQQLSEHEVNALNQSFGNSSNYYQSFSFEVDNTVDNDWQTILNERGTEHITFEREGIKVSIERLENDRIEVTYAFRDALENMSEEELESFIYGEYQKDKVNINEGGQTEFLTTRITDRLNDTSNNPSIVHGASETTLTTPQELPKTGIALIGGTVGSALALLFSGAFAGLFSLRRK